MNHTPRMRDRLLLKGFSVKPLTLDDIGTLFTFDSKKVNLRRP